MSGNAVQIALFDLAASGSSRPEIVQRDRYASLHNAAPPDDCN